jgi:hypothetical protein
MTFGLSDLAVIDEGHNKNPVVAVGVKNAV